MQIRDVVAQRYELQEALGGGGLGQVFRALDQRELREVALKVLDPARCPEAALRRHGALMTAAARAKHPAIVLSRVQAAGAGHPPLIVSELVAGEDLDGLRARVGALPWRRAAEIVATCAEALGALATASGAAHRALKPGNIRVTEDGGVRLLDFGIAELGPQPVGPRGGVYVEYRAPEQLEGAAGDASADVFTLGVLLFEMVTGVHPFAGPSAFKVSHKLLLQGAPRPSEVAAELALPATVEALLARALARRPADRFADPAELGKMLNLVRRASGAALAPAPVSPKASPPDDGTAVIPTAAPEADDPSTMLHRARTGDSVALPPAASTAAPAPAPAAPEPGVVGAGPAPEPAAPVRAFMALEPAPVRAFVAPVPVRTFVAPPEAVSSGLSAGPPLLESAALAVPAEPIDPSTVVVAVPAAEVDATHALRVAVEDGDATHALRVAAEDGDATHALRVAAEDGDATHALRVAGPDIDATHALRVAGPDIDDTYALRVPVAPAEATVQLTAAEHEATSRPPARVGPSSPARPGSGGRRARQTRTLLLLNVVLVALAAAGFAYMWLG